MRSEKTQVFLPGTYFYDIIFTGLAEFPRLGTEIYSRGFEIHPGGCFNMATALHRLGVRVGWATEVGTDLFSQLMVELANREGLDTSLFQHYPAPVRRVTVALSYPEDRAFVSYMDEVPPLPAAELIAQIRPAWVLLPHLHYGDAYQEWFAAARRIGASLYMDCQFNEATLDTPGVVEALQSVDIFAPNQAEALQLTGADCVEEALDCLAELAPVAVIKLGSGGAVARRGKQEWRVPGLPVEVLDTTGAGDCFNAGYLAAALEGANIHDCLVQANVCGALSTTGVGGASALTREQVQAVMQKL